MEFDRRRDLGEITELGLTLSEAKRLLVRVQQEIVAAQVRDHAVLRPECPSCGGGCHVKDWQHHAVATLFGAVAVRLPRFRCIRCGRNASGISWPSHCRSTPELDKLRAHLSALMPFRVAADVLSHLLPVAAGMSPETLRGHTLKIGERLRAAPAVNQVAAASSITVTTDSTYIRSRDDGERQIEVRVGNVETADGCAGLQSILADAGVTQPPIADRRGSRIMPRLRHAKHCCAEPASGNGRACSA
jgi:hypothetical protein